jgi:His-Xaa-Ser system radical SAM maturase HxsB
MSYAPVALPHWVRKLEPCVNLCVSSTGDYAFLSDDELEVLESSPHRLPLERQADLKARFILATASSAGALNPGTLRLLESRKAARGETATSGPGLHIIVPTLQCAHSCRYCQVSRALDDEGHSMSDEVIDLASDSIFQSPAMSLTVEYQGGDPLLRFDLVKRSIERIARRNETEGRQIRFVIASTLHQLTEAMCDFFAQHDVFMSTSIDGRKELHNRNRPTPSRDSYGRTLAGIELARRRLGSRQVAALMTTTKESLAHPEAIVDEYVRLGFNEIFLRPLSAYGFAKRNQAFLAYRLRDFQEFYDRAFDRVLFWNRQGFELREAYAAIILNKVLSTFDAGYVDLQCPTGAGRSVLVYNYDGYVYPSDEARMLAETGDTTLRLGRIGDSLQALAVSRAQIELEQASLDEHERGCRDCAYQAFCAPNPVDSLAQYGNRRAPAQETEHCQRHMALFDKFYGLIRTAEPWTLDLFHAWARPTGRDVA